MAEAVTVVAVRSNFVLARWRNVVIACFRGGGLLADVEQFHRTSVEVGKAHRDGIGHVNIVQLTESDRSAPGDDVREALLRMLRDPAVPLVASSVVFAGVGFQGAMIRGVLSGLMIFARTRASIRVHATLDEGADWLADRLAAAKTPSIVAADLVGAARDVPGMRPPDGA